MPKRKAPNSRTDATPRASPRGELVKLRAKLAAAEASARACAEAERRMGEELEVYQEEAAQQTRQLVEANEALETSHARYVSLYDYAPVAFVSLDHNGVIDDLNLAA